MLFKSNLAVCVCVFVKSIFIRCMNPSSLGIENKGECVVEKHEHLPSSLNSPKSAISIGIWLCVASLSCMLVSPNIL